LEGKNYEIKGEIKKQDGTIKELRTSYILEKQRSERNIEVLSNASL
jgi:hypothetical protein